MHEEADPGWLRDRDQVSDEVSPRLCRRLPGQEEVHSEPGVARRGRRVRAPDLPAPHAAPQRARIACLVLSR